MTKPSPMPPDPIAEFSYSEHLTAAELDDKFPRGGVFEIESIDRGEVFDLNRNQSIEKAKIKFVEFTRCWPVGKLNLRVLLSAFGKPLRETLPGKKVRLSTSMKSNGKRGIDVEVVGKEEAS